MEENMYYNKLKNMITKAMKNGELVGVESIYAYGSVASGEFVPGKSDVDLFVVISDGLKERVTLEKKIISGITEIASEFIKVFSDAEIQNHNATILTVNEFRSHCTQYPGRVLYLLKEEIWKLVYGRNLHDDLQLPEQDELNRCIAIDFDLFANEWYLSALHKGFEGAKKVYLRALKKFIWIVFDEYVVSRDTILERLEHYLPGDETTKGVIDGMNRMTDCEIGTEEYISVFHMLNKGLLEYGRLIKEKLTFLQYPIEAREFYNVSLWRDYSWELRQTINRYHMIRMKKEETVLAYRDYLTNDYWLTIEYILFACSQPKELVRFGKSNINGIKRSYIHQFNTTDFSKVLVLLETEPFRYLFIEHKKLLQKGYFDTLSESELMSYIEEKYLSIMQDAFHILFNQ